MERRLILQVDSTGWDQFMLVPNDASDTWRCSKQAAKDKPLAKNLVFNLFPFGHGFNPRSIDHQISSKDLSLAGSTTQKSSARVRLSVLIVKELWLVSFF